MDTFSELIEELKQLQAEHAEFNRPEFFYDMQSISGEVTPCTTILANRTERLLVQAAKGGVFGCGYLKLLQDTASMMPSVGLEPFLRKLMDLTGDNLLVPTEAPAISRLKGALESLHQHGALDDRPQMAKWRGIAREAERILTPDKPRKQFMAELTKQCGRSERQLFRDFAGMRKLSEFKAYPWLNAGKSASTRTKKKRKEIAQNTQH